MKYIETESIKNVLNGKIENHASEVLLSLFMGRYYKVQATEYITCTNIKYNSTFNIEFEKICSKCLIFFLQKYYKILSEHVQVIREFKATLLHYQHTSSTRLLLSVIAFFFCHFFLLFYQNFE
jgi:hypothetical protein